VAETKMARDGQFDNGLRPIDGMATSINGSCNEATASASGEALTDIVQLSLACVLRKRIFRWERNFLIAKADNVPANNKEP
jgi:hypothetical protein